VLRLSTPVFLPYGQQTTAANTYGFSCTGDSLVTGRGGRTRNALKHEPRVEAIYLPYCLHASIFPERSVVKASGLLEQVTRAKLPKASCDCRGVSVRPCW
jgi:hypothetical protein